MVKTIGKTALLSTLTCAALTLFACGDSQGGTDGPGSDPGITSASTRTAGEGSTTSQTTGGSTTSSTDPQTTEDGSETLMTGSNSSTTDENPTTSGMGSSSTTDEDLTTGDTSNSTGDMSTGSTTGVEPEPELEHVDVVITSDNAYKFCYGFQEGVETCYGDVHATSACQIFCCNGGPEVYQVEGDVAENSEYLYIVAWSDDAVTYGVIGYFKAVFEDMAEEITFTGTEDWEVCATGMDYDQEAGPNNALISQEITACNQPGHPKGGWLGTTPSSHGMIALGEDNSSNAGDFPLVCDNLMWETYMPPEAAWMGINPWPNGVIPPGQSPFNSSDVGTGNLEFLIYRLKVDTVITIE